MRKSRLLAVIGCAGMVGVGATSVSTSAAEEAGAAQSCTPRTNVEFINDDSGSMASLDFEKNRVEAIKLLLGKAANRGGRTYGAVEFGTRVSSLFQPTRIRQTNLSSLFGILDARTKDDGSNPDPAVDGGGGTNYNAAFFGARGNNPNAQARVFLTDGGHNEGTYVNAHRGGPPTYVIGFGSSTSGENGARLTQIAAETKGQYFPQTDSGNLTGIVNSIDNTLNCVKSRTFTDNFTRQGQSKRHGLRLSRNTRVIEFTTLWTNNTDSFSVAGIRVVRRGRTIAIGSARRKRKPAKLRVRRVRGKTFVTVRVRGKALRRGKKKGRRLRFRIKAKRISAPTQVVTSVSQSRR